MIIGKYKQKRPNYATSMLFAMTEWDETEMINQNPDEARSDGRMQALKAVL
jgi:hypothetical protein